MKPMHPKIAQILEDLAQGRPVQSVALHLVHARIMDVPVTFCVNFEKDPIQRHHRKGTFYELNELCALRSIFPAGGVFIDVGANVGNHSLFAAQHLKASRVIPFEPNPLAYELLIENVLVNGLADTVDLSVLGVGLSDRRRGGYAMQPRSHNLGAARMLAGGGQLEVYRGDDLLADIDPDMVKIDVETMELAVLEGLSGLLTRCRPVLLVEVDLENEAAFSEWTEAAGYAVVSTYQRYKTNRNHILADRNQAIEIQQRLAA